MFVYIYIKKIKSMETHRGQVVKSIVKQSGYSLATLAKRLCISRSTLYNRFNTKNLPYEFIISVGYVIGFDFTPIFPALKNRVKIQVSSAKDEYIMLLEHYNDLLALTTKTLVNTSTLHMRQKVAKFAQNTMPKKIQKSE